MQLCPQGAIRAPRRTTYTTSHRAMDGVGTCICHHWHELQAALAVAEGRIRTTRRRNWRRFCVVAVQGPGRNSSNYRWQMAAIRQLFCSQPHHRLPEIQGRKNHRELPAYSPDLNPIENYWSYLARGVGRYLRGLSATAENRLVVWDMVKMWHRMSSQAIVASFVASLDQRIVDGIALSGDWIRK